MLNLSFDELTSAVGGVVIFVVIVIILIFTLLFSLKVGINAVKGKNDGYGEIFLTVILMNVVSFLLLLIPVFPLIMSILSFVIGLLIIKARHETSFLGALGAIIIALIVMVVVLLVLGLIFDFTLMALFELLY